MKNKQFLYYALSAIGVILFIGVSYILTNKPAQTKPVEEAAKIKTSDHVSWNKNAKHLIVEYSDIQCPACQSYHMMFKEIAKDKKISDNFALVYRHFPLDSIHPNARVASYATEAAAKQGKFFEMLDILFTKKSEWESSIDPKTSFINLAKELKLDIAKFEKDFTDADIIKKVDADYASGIKAGVEATPTFFIDGWKTELGGTTEAIKRALESALQAK